jgi:hypothetical protein
VTSQRATPRRGSYRVYTEEEFFASAGPLASAGTPAAPARVPCAAPPACGRRTPVGARVMWCALLGVVLAAVAGVVARDGVRSRAGGRLLADGGVVPHPLRARRSAPVAARAPFGGTVRRRSARWGPRTFSRAARRRAHTVLVPPARPHVSPVVVAAPAAPAAPTSTTATAPAASATTTASSPTAAPASPAATATAAATAATAHGARAEFGFER